MAVHPHVMAELAEDIALPAAGDEHLRRVLHRQPGLLAGEADALELPGALERARRPQRRHAVDEIGTRHELAVAKIGGGGHDVELEAQAEALRQAARRQRRGQRAQRREGLDAPQRALPTRSLQIAPNQQQRLAHGRHDQVGVLRRAAQVHEIRGLHDQRRIDPVALQARLERRDAAVDLLGRRRGRQHGRRR